MRTVFEALKSCVGYRVPDGTIEDIAVRRGIHKLLQTEVSTSVMDSGAYALCEADIMKYLTTVANIGEGGVSITMSEKNILVGTANAIYAKYGQPLVGESALQPTVENISDE